MANIYKVSWTKAEYDAYITGGGTIPSNYEVFITDAAAGTPNLYTGTGTNTPISGNVGGTGGGGAVFEDWEAGKAYAIGDKVIATVTIGVIGAGSRLRRNTAGTSGTTFDSTEAAKWTELAVDDDVVPKTDIINDLTTGGTSKVLSAEQGKTLETNKAPLASPVFTGTVSGITKSMVGLGSVDNTADTAKPVSTAQQTALNGKSATTHNHDATYTAIAHGTNTSNPHSVTKTQVGLGSVDNTADTAKPVSTAQQTALDGKQTTLVSGTNIKTLNGASVLGSGNVSVAADLPGGTAQTATNDGLVSTGGTILGTAVGGTDTVIQYNNSGSFTVPIGVSNVRALVVGGGASGDMGVGGGVYGHGGGGGFVNSVDSLTVTAGQSITVTVGTGGPAPTAQGQVGGAGNPSSFGATTANGGTAANNIGTAGDGGDSGKMINGVTTNFAGGADGTWGAAGGAGADGVSAAAADTTGSVGGAGLSSNITGASISYGTGGDGSGTTTASPAVSPTNVGRGGHGHGTDARAGGTGVVIVRFATQSRSYQALTSYADNSAAIAGGRLIGEFYKKTSDGSVQQVT